MATISSTPQGRTTHMPVIPSLRKVRPARQRRYKAASACSTCRRRKVKCDGVRPACSRCQKEAELRGRCLYGPVTEPLRAPQLVSSQPADQLDTPSQFSEEAEHRPFSSKVSAAIHAEVGQTDEDEESYPAPLLDAPLFGSLHIPVDQSFEKGPMHENSSDLPARKYADDLLSLYWLHLDSIEPVLDQHQFCRSYQALYAGRDMRDERIFLSTLNVVFALAEQLQESVSSESRNRASSTFFLRAWALLRPEFVIWEPGSLELAQCLLLMARYLQCTSNPHKTCTILGSVVRIVRSLDYNSRSGRTCHIDQIRELWHQCAYLDRALAWSFGKPLAVHSISAPAQPTMPRDPQPNPSTLSVYVSDGLFQVDGLVSQILLAEMLVSHDMGEAVGLPRLPSKMNTASITHIEGRLSELSSLVEHQVSLHTPDAHTSRRLRLFRLRLAHARIFLYRPMLAQFCLTPQANPSKDATLQSCAMQSCASLCVDNAAKMLSLVCEASATAPTLLPWWHRVFYLFASSQYLLSAMLRPDVFATRVYELRNAASEALARHQHLSPAVQRCAYIFERLAQKINDTCGSAAGDGDGIVNPNTHGEAAVHDILEQFDFDIDGPFFHFQDYATWPADWNI